MEALALMVDLHPHMPAVSRCVRTKPLNFKTVGFSEKTTVEEVDAL
jgi:hypothetical protein